MANAEGAVFYTSLFVALLRGSPFVYCKLLMERIFVNGCQPFTGFAPHHQSLVKLRRRIDIVQQGAKDSYPPKTDGT